MIIKKIKSETEYKKIVAWLDNQLDNNNNFNTQENNNLVLALLEIKVYEGVKYPIPFPNTLTFT